MDREESKRIEISRIEERRQITAILLEVYQGEFLPIQLVYKGTTTKCLLPVTFPKKWHITATYKHWCNEDTMIQYITRIILPYLEEKKASLGLPASQLSLLIQRTSNWQGVKFASDKCFLYNCSTQLHRHITTPWCQYEQASKTFSLTKIPKMVCF